MEVGGSGWKGWEWGYWAVEWGQRREDCEDAGSHSHSQLREPDRVELAATNSHNSANKLFIVIIILSLAMNYRNILCIIHSYQYTEQRV